MLKLLSISAVFVIVQCCDKSSFNDVRIHASKYFHLIDEDDVKTDKPISGCIMPNEELKNVVQIIIKNQDIPIMHEGAVQDLQWLHTLKMEQNGIEDIEPGAFLNLPSISSLSLAMNKLKEIREGVFNKMTIQRLFLNNNMITKIAPGAFDDMRNLNRIDMDHNGLKEWNSDWFTNTPKIRYLSVTFNQLSELPENAFKNFNGRYEETGKTLVISSFYFSHNKIDKIHSNSFKGLKELNFLDFDYNNITDIDTKVFNGFNSITNLMLDGNKITCLSDNVLTSFPSTELITLNGNPIECNCLKAMKDWGRSHTMNLKMNIRSIECMQERIRGVLDSVKNIN